MRYLIAGGLIMAIISGLSWQTNAQNNNPWFSGGQTNTLLAETYSMSDQKSVYLGSQDHCQPHYIMFNGKLVEKCATHSSRYPVFNGQLYVADSSKSHVLYDTSEPNAGYITAPGQDYILQTEGKGYGATLNKIDRAYDLKQAYSHTNKQSVKWYIGHKPKTRIEDDKNQEDLRILDGHTSPDDKFFVGINIHGVFVLNLETLALKYVHEGLYTSSGLNPNLKLAVSNNGQNVTFYAGNKQDLKIIDVNNCQNNTAKKGVEANCQSLDITKDVFGAFGGQYSSQLKIKRIEFTKNDNLSMFVPIYFDDITKDYKYQRLYISKNQVLASGLDYLAMGDSYASGEGAYEYRDGNDESWNKCHLSAVSYPYLIKKTSLFDTTQSVACSGARMKDVIDINNSEYKDNNPQSKKYISDDYNYFVKANFLVGSIRQYEFVNHYQPAHITISISGNDIGFGGIVRKCVLWHTDCYQLPQERSQLVDIINARYGNMIRTFKHIKQTAPINTKVYVLGYPKVAKADGNCANNVRLSNKEIIFSNNLIDYLNRVIEMAANHSGTYYVDVSDALAGHKLCETSSSQVAVNGFTMGNDSPLGNIGPFGQESYHPNALGHQLYAKTIIQKTNNLTVEMPSPIPDSPYLIDPQTINLLNGLNEPPRTAKTNSYYEDSLSLDVVTKNQQIELKINGNDYDLEPDSNFEAWAYSTPMFLGTLTTNEHGDIDASVVLPDSLEPGYHTIHVRGQNVFGEAVDIQKIVYVAETIEDFDGDGILNEDEICLIGEPAGVDADKDGIDDACDGFIDEPPTEPEDVGVVANPEAKPTTKDLPVSESRPQWLLDLESVIQARNLEQNQEIPEVTLASNDQSSARLLPSIATNTSELEASDEEVSKPQENQSILPQTSSATEVKSATQRALDQKDSSGWAWLIIALFAVITIGAPLMLLLKVRK